MSPLLVSWFLLLLFAILQIIDNRIVALDELIVNVKIRNAIGIAAQRQKLLIGANLFNIALIQTNSLFVGIIHHNRAR